MTGDLAQVLLDALLSHLVHLVLELLLIHGLLRPLVDLVDLIADSLGPCTTPSAWRICTRGCRSRRSLLEDRVLGAAGII